MLQNVTVGVSYNFIITDDILSRFHNNNKYRHPEKFKRRVDNSAK